MILTTTGLAPNDLARATSWVLKPEGLCQGDRCVPYRAQLDTNGRLDACQVAERLHMPLVHDATHGVWALGPESGGRVLSSAQLPEIVLPDFDGNLFDLATLRGQKVVIHAWASW